MHLHHSCVVFKAQGSMLKWARPQSGRETKHVAATSWPKPTSTQLALPVSGPSRQAHDLARPNSMPLSLGQGRPIPAPLDSGRSRHAPQCFDHILNCHHSLSRLTFKTCTRFFHPFSGKAGDGEPLLESLIWLLLTSEVPTKEQADSLTAELHERAAKLPSHVVPLLNSLPKDMHPTTQFSIGLSAAQTASTFAKAYGECPDLATLRARLLWPGPDRAIVGPASGCGYYARFDQMALSARSLWLN